MKIERFIMFIFFPLMFCGFISCEKEENNNEYYKYTLEIKGDTLTHFSNLGEMRNFELRIVKNTLQENKIISQESYMDFDNIQLEIESVFSINEITYEDSYLSFVISACENIEEEEQLAFLYIRISDQTNPIQCKISLVQNKAMIKYEYIIESETNSFHIPPEGGEFFIPITCKKKIHRNGFYLREEPSDMIGLTYLSKCMNASYIHWDSLYKNLDNLGNYILKVVADGPYCIDGEFEWEISILKDEEKIFTQIIFHPQTKQEEYLYGMSSLITRYPLEI